jgi:hypothetical protein
MLSGALAAAFSAPAAVTIMGAACALGAAKIYLAIPHVRTIR